MEQSNGAWKKIKNLLKLVWDPLAIPPWSRKQQPPLYCYDMKIYWQLLVLASRYFIWQVKKRSLSNNLVF